MRTLEELRNTRRMFYIRLQANNISGGLFDMIKETITKDTVMVEIGCFSGVSSEIFAKHVKHITCVDIWDNGVTYDRGLKTEYLTQARKEFNEMAKEYSNISVIENFSTEAAKQFEDESLDLVYVDARHDYEACKEDLLAWIPKVKKGGWICGHDIKIKGVFKAVNEILGPHYKDYSDESYAIRK